MLFIKCYTILCLLLSPVITTHTMVQSSTIVWLNRLFDDSEAHKYDRKSFVESATQYNPKDNLEIVKAALKFINLLDFNEYDYYCLNSNISLFSQCSGRYKNILVLKQSFPASEKKEDDLAKFTHNVTDEFYYNETKSVAMFKPYVIAVRNALVNQDGNIFNKDEYYLHGGCADLSWHTANFTYNSSHTYERMAVTMIEEPILLLAQPYETVFGHEFVEVYSYIIMVNTVIAMFPHIKIVARSYLSAKMLPLLELFGFNYTAIVSNIIILENERNVKLMYDGRRNITFNGTEITHRLIYSPYVITPLASRCIIYDKPVIDHMRRQFLTLSNWSISPSSLDNTIVLYDRYNDDNGRKILTGDELIGALRREFSKRFKIVRFFGNESFEDTVKLFNTCRVVVGAHGSGLTNEVFMKKGSVIVEIRPQNFDVKTIMLNAEMLGIKHYVYHSGKGRARGNIPLVVPDFILFLKTVLKKDMIEF